MPNAVPLMGQLKRQLLCSARTVKIKTDPPKCDVYLKYFHNKKIILIVPTNFYKNLGQIRGIFSRSE